MRNLHTEAECPSLGGKSMNYKETFSTATKQEISKIENFIGTLLPSDYTAFLMKIGGGLLKIDDTNKLYIEDINDAVVMDI